MVNDFKKKELENILFVLENSFEGLDDLINKVKSMIDNYDEKECNHDFIEIYSNPKARGTNSLNMWICRYCHMKVGPVSKYNNDLGCDHEYENNFEIDSRPIFEKSKNPICKKCGEYY